MGSTVGKLPPPPKIDTSDMTEDEIQSLIAAMRNTKPHECKIAYTKRGLSTEDFVGGMLIGGMF